MTAVKKKGFTCEKSPPLIMEQICLPETRKDLIPGYNFNTSTSIGLKSIPSPNIYFEVKPLFTGKEKQVVDMNSGKKHYITSNESYHPHKLNIDPINQANRFRGTKNLFIKEFEEKLKKSSIYKMSDPISTYKRYYTMHQLTPDVNGEIRDITPNIMCKIKSIAKNAQSLIDMTSPSSIKHLDNYVTQTKFDYTYIPQEKRDFYQTPKDTFITKPEKNASRIYEEGMFKKKFLDRTIPKHIFRVPNSGMITEFQREYKNFWGEKYKTPKPIYERIETLGLSPQEVMLVPGMYKSENSRYGSLTSP